MKIVIEIPDIVKTRCDDGGIMQTIDIIKLKNAVAHGTPLPEHHGKLVDADKMMARLCKDDCKQTNGECKYFTRCSFWDAVQEAETIIPATKEGESE